jgi:purine-binding chemotaxis protein CheW
MVYQNEITAVQIVVFRLDLELYGVDISRVSEMLDPQNLIREAGTSGNIEGMIETRGKFVPVIDLRKRFHLPRVEPNKDRRILVVSAKNGELGIIVDSVSELVKVQRGSVLPIDSLFIGNHIEHLLGVLRINHNPIILMDMDSLISTNDQEIIKTLGNKYQTALC